jgi:hypothetical protein
MIPSMNNCSTTWLNIIEVISFCSSESNERQTLLVRITGLTLINFCLRVTLSNIELLTNIRYFYFDHCSIDFQISQQSIDYDIYPVNLSRWSFDHGQTHSFEQFINMINYLGPLKFHLTFTGCFHPVLSFDDFSALDTQLILLNLTCEQFRLEQPLNNRIRTAIFLTPTIMIDMLSARCPSANVYDWLNYQPSSTTNALIRTLTCDNRLIYLNFDRMTTMTRSLLNSQSNVSTRFIENTSSIRLTQDNSWTMPMMIEFVFLLLSIVLMSVALTIGCIRF